MCFGLRKVDLQLLEGHSGIICFFWDNQAAPLLNEFKEILAALMPAADGQYKVQVYGVIPCRGSNASRKKKRCERRIQAASSRKGVARKLG